MTYRNYLLDDVDMVVRTAAFEVGHQADELHVILYAGKKYKKFDEQLRHLEEAIRRIPALPGFEKFNLVFKRYFLSDAANEADLIEKTERSGNDARSMVQQPLLNGSKVALWAYFLKESAKKEDPETCCVEKNGYHHRWTAMLRKLDGNTYEQTLSIFEDYCSRLRSKGNSLKDNCIRMWFYIQNVDRNYAEMVEARKKIFEKEGLNAKTHYIACTVIEGRNQYLTSSVYADAYSVDGLNEGQVSFLYAPTHLSPTIIYGVTFERGTCITYGDRRHIFISGTSSIDREGKIVHPNQIEQQMKRALENIEVLLKEAGANYKDVAHLFIYLRDLSDYDLVNNYMESHYSEIPKIIVWAPVCRPGWLIEMECMAVIDYSDKRFRNF